MGAKAFSPTGMLWIAALHPLYVMGSIWVSFGGFWPQQPRVGADREVLSMERTGARLTILTLFALLEVWRFIYLLPFDAKQRVAAALAQQSYARACATSDRRRRAAFQYICRWTAALIVAKLVPLNALLFNSVASVKHHKLVAAASEGC